MVARKIPKFDPTPSAALAVEVCRETQTPFALIGRVALWTLLPESQQEFTKDVDFAVPRQSIDALQAAFDRRGLKAVPLEIGGIAVRDGDLRIDLIDRHVDGLDPLFHAAIDAAAAGDVQAEVGDVTLPVVPADFLVALKIVAGEDRDEADAVKLLKAFPDLDLAKLRETVLAHGGAGSANRLDALARKAGHPQARRDYRNSG